MDTATIVWFSGLMTGVLIGVPIGLVLALWFIPAVIDSWNRLARNSRPNERR